MGITKAIEDLSDAELRVVAPDLAHENRRLRQILDTLARAGIGKGALVELYTDRDGKRVIQGVVVCRADRDEREFMADIATGCAALFEAAGLVLQHETAHLTGVNAIQGTDAVNKDGDPSVNGP